MSNMIKKTTKPENKELLNVNMFDGQTTGFEGTNAETFKTPFIKILQLLSPELNKNKSDYIPNAKSGLFCNTASKQLYEDINVIVLKIEHNLLVWKPNRRGFVGVYPKSKEGEIVYKVDGVKKYDKDMNEINDTISFFCVNADDPSDIFILSLAAASFKHGRSWSTRMRMLKVNEKPVRVSYASVWNISTTEESNDKGSWHSLGNTPNFKRFITEKEYENIIKPALEMLTNSEVDYSNIEEKSSIDENVEY